MSSPRTMWSGTISLGLLNVPVTIGKTWSDLREESLRDICADHFAPIDRTERCGAGHKDCSLAKVKGVLVGDEWFALDASEKDRIEAATKSDALSILDVQPAFDLPLEYGTGTYYVRHNTKAKVPPDAFRHFVAALRAGDRAAIVKWCRSSRQKLAVLHVQEDPDGKGELLLLLTTLPMREEWRAPGDQERSHQGGAVDKKMVGMMDQLLDSVASNGFVWNKYADEGLKIRQEVVEKILSGQDEGKDEQKDEQKIEVPDLMATLTASLNLSKQNQEA